MTHEELKSCFINVAVRYILKVPRVHLQFVNRIK